MRYIQLTKTKPIDGIIYGVDQVVLFQQPLANAVIDADYGFEVFDPATFTEHEARLATLGDSVQVANDDEPDDGVGPNVSKSWWDKFKGWIGLT